MVSDMVQRARAALLSEPRIGQDFRLDRIEITPDGALVVEGEMPSVAAKKLALEHIGALDGVDLILDRLFVTPASPMGDGEIRAHLRNSYSDEASFKGLKIIEIKDGGPDVISAPEEATGKLEYEVSDGTVVLNGEVGGLDTKRLAGVLAWWVPGTRNLINGIAVPDSEIDSAISIESAVRIALEKDPFVNASQVRIGVRDRVVRLTGSVRSEAERDMAEKDAWYVFGTNDVINELELNV